MRIKWTLTKLVFQVGESETAYQERAVVIETDKQHEDEEDYDRLHDKQVEPPDILWGNKENSYD